MAVRKPQRRPRSRHFQRGAVQLPSIRNLFAGVHSHTPTSFTKTHEAAKSWVSDYGWLCFDGYDVEQHLPKNIQRCVPFVVRCLEEHFGQPLVAIDPIELADVYLARDTGREWAVYDTTDLPTEESTSSNMTHESGVDGKTINKIRRQNRASDTEKSSQVLRREKTFEVRESQRRHKVSERDRRKRYHYYYRLGSYLCSDFIRDISEHRVQAIKVAAALEDLFELSDRNRKHGAREPRKQTVQMLGKDELHTQAILGGVFGGIVALASIAEIARLREEKTALSEAYRGVCEENKRLREQLQMRPDHGEPIWSSTQAAQDWTVIDHPFDNLTKVSSAQRHADTDWTVVHRPFQRSTSL